MRKVLLKTISPALAFSGIILLQIFMSITSYAQGIGGATSPENTQIRKTMSEENSLSTNNDTLNINLYPQIIPESIHNGRIWFLKEYQGNVWIAGDSAVIAKSKDLNDWQIMNNGLPSEGINYLEFLNPYKIYAAGQGGSIFKTSDGGQNWFTVYTNLKETDFINKIKFFDDMNGIALGDQAQDAPSMAILNTTDGGKTWSNYNTFLVGTSHINGVEFEYPSNVYLYGYYTINGFTYNGIWKSTTRGKSWDFFTVGNSAVDSITTVDCIMFKDSEKGYAAKKDSTLWETNDGGYSWTEICKTSTRINSITPIENSNSIYCLGLKGYMLKINFESIVSIQEKFHEGGMYFIWGDFPEENEGYLLTYSTSLDRFFTTFTREKRWQQADEIYDKTIYSLITNDGGVYAGTMSGEVFRSTDKGITWNSVSNGLVNCRSIQTLAAKENDLYAGTESGGIFRSTNQGDSWEAMNNGLTSLDIRSLAVSGNNIIAGTAREGMFLSRDNGYNWTKINLNLEYITVGSLTAQDNTVYAGIQGTGVFKSTNNGFNWDFIEGGLLNNSIQAINVHGDRLLVGTWDHGVYTPNDYDSQWRQVNDGLTCLNIEAITSRGDDVFVGTLGGGVFYTTDENEKWSSFNIGLASQYVLSLSVDEDFIYAGTNANGVWRRSLSGSDVVDVKENKNNVPFSYMLSQNYPNPFNPETIIEYNLSKGGFVTLKVYDILGREVAALVDEFKQAGSYNSKFSIQDFQLSSGVYFYRLQAGNFSETKKMILIR